MVDASPRPLSGKRILIVVENLPVPFDRRVWQEAVALRDAGAEVEIISPAVPGCETPEEILDGIRIHRHPLKADGGGAKAYLKEYAQALFHQTRLAWKIFRARGFDAIHACNPPDLVFMVAAPFKLLGRKFVFDQHDLCPELYEAKFGRRDLPWRALRLAERLTYALADAVIATNGSYRRIALERGRKRPEDVFVVRSAPDLARLKPVPANPARRRGRAQMIAWLGVIGEQEGLDRLLDAMVRLVRGEGRDLQAVIVGDGPAAAGLRDLALRLGIRDHVEFTGRVSDADLVEILCSADLCVNADPPTPMNDLSTMNKVLEYMALGKPIVQFDVTEGRVSAGEASLYARADDPADFAACIGRLLDDPDLRARMGEIGRRRMVEELHWGRSVPHLVAAHRRAIFGRKAAG